MTPEQTKKFKYWQTRTIIVSMIGYALYYFVRKNFNTAMPSIEATFGITKTQLGIFLTLNGVIYGVSRFINGFIADRVSARKFIALGLALCALVNIGFGFSDKMALLITGTAGGSEYITALTIIMGSILLLNGYFQGMGVPPVSPLMTHWVPANELATKMSIWNMSHSIGAGLIFVLGALLVHHFDNSAWRLCFLVPAAAETARRKGEAVEWVPTLELTLCFDEAKLSLEEAARFLGDTCRNLENFWDLLL